jgi:hypothetical protein
MSFPANAIGVGAALAAGAYYGYQAQPALVAGTTTAGIPPYFTVGDWVILLGLLFAAIYFGLVLS